LEFWLTRVPALSISSMCIRVFKPNCRTKSPYQQISSLSGGKTSTTASMRFPVFCRWRLAPAARFVGYRPGTEVRWQIDRHAYLQADYGIFYAGQFLKQASPGRNINYSEFWFGYKF